MASGLIQTLTPRFPESGSPTLSVSGADRRVKLRDRKPTKKDVKQFVKKKDYDMHERLPSATAWTQLLPRRAGASGGVQKNQDDLTS